jgi:hypothetical protein
LLDAEEAKMKLGFSALIILMIFPSMVTAQYVVGPSVIAGGGARMTGGGYVITGTTGQSAPIGISTGGAYITQHGFWYAVTGGGGGLSPMVLSIALLNASTARLSWYDVPGATFYDLYRSSVPYFHATGPVWQTVADPTTYLDFTAGIGNPNANWTYIGIARNATQESPESNIVGEFDYHAQTAATNRDVETASSSD